MADTTIYLRSPLRQGRTLMTPTTRHWSPEQMRENDESEARKICLNFHEEDQGKSRVIVAQTFGKDAPDIARRLIACWNACQGIPTPNLEKGVMEEVKTYVRRIAGFAPGGQNADDDADTVNSLRKYAGPLIARLDPE